MDDYAANAKTPTEDITSTLLWSSDENAH